MPIRFSCLFIALLLIATGCANPTRCDEERSEPYMDPRTGEPLELEDLDARGSDSERFRIPGEERASRGDANPCLAQAPRIVPMPIAPDRDVEEGTGFADLRYRLALVDEDGFSERAESSTLRLRLGGTTPRIRGFDAGIAFQTTEVIGNARYEDTTGLPGDFPVVRDPSDTIASEGWVRYVSRENMFQAQLGRQPLRLDNERFVGTDSFRQLEQTFNASAIRIGAGEPVRFDAIYISQVNRVLGPNHPERLQAKANMEASVLEYNQAFGDQTMGLYYHSMRFRDARESHRNYGFRFHGRMPWTENFDFRVEMAKQGGLSNEGPDETLGYHHFRLGQNLDGWRWYYGRERLEGNREDSVQTPLASLHEFNGWTDRFLKTPSFGLIDKYAGLEFQRGDWDFEAQLHEYEVEAGSGRYGQEFGVRAGRPMFGDLRFDFKLSHYKGFDPVFYTGEDYSADSTRAWFGLTGHFKP